MHNKNAPHAMILVGTSIARAIFYTSANEMKNANCT